MVRFSFAAADELLIAGDLDAVMIALDEMAFRTGEPEAIVGCEDLVARLPGATALVQSMMGMVGRGEAAISSCNVTDIESALADIEGSSTTNVKLEEVKARLEAAQEACQPLAEEPEKVVAAEPPPENEEGAGALEILRDALRGLESDFSDSADPVTRGYAEGIASGDRRSASVVYVVETGSWTRDLLDPNSVVTVYSRATVSNRITLTKFASDEEARPLPQPGDEVSDGSVLGFPSLSDVGGDGGTTHAILRFSKRSIRVEIVSDRTSFTILEESSENGWALPWAGVTALGLGKELFGRIDPNL